MLLNPFGLNCCQHTADVATTRNDSIDISNRSRYAQVFRVNNPEKDCCTGEWACGSRLPKRVFTAEAQRRGVWSLISSTECVAQRPPAVCLKLRHSLRWSDPHCHEAHRRFSRYGECVRSFR